VNTRVHTYYPMRTRGCGCIGRPAFPTPSVFRAEINCKPRTHRAARMRRCIQPPLRGAPATKQSSFCLAAPKLDCFRLRSWSYGGQVASLAMTARYSFAIPAAHCARALTKFSAPEGVGNAGCRCTRSRACSVVSTRVSHHEAPEQPGIPARNGLRLISCSPR
jgi:hypothetical protein